MYALKASALAAIVTFTLAVCAQQPAPPPPQTARQALIEMISGGEKGFTRHLTLEMQRALNKKGTDDAIAALRVYSSMGSRSQDGVKTFDSGPVLATFTNRRTHEKVEIRVESDDLSGEEDSLALSLHTFADGQEQTDGWDSVFSRITLEMKRQDGLWRLNKTTIAVQLSVGDPTFFDRLFGKQGAAKSTGLAMVMPATDHSGEIVAPPMPPERVVAMLAMAESMVARLHPEVGFSCSLSDLAESSQPFGLDAQIFNGVYNGYRFAVKGCEGNPVGSFQITGEPAAPQPGAKAFCTDATQNLRESEDGRAATCLTAGKVHRETDQAGEAASFSVVTGSTPKQ